jgi:hypothetical protein
MQELLVNLHMHTPYSDGFGSHAQIAQAGLHAGLDVVITTDHNVLVNGPEDYYRENGRQLLLLVGEEIHDQARQPQKNHLLAFGIDRELATLAYDPQRLLDTIRQLGGYAFIAHPVDPEAPAFHEPDISWVDWGVQGYHGIELWNGMSEFKSLLKSKLHALFYSLNPRRIAHGPFPETIRRWDELLSSGRRVAAVGGSDAHALPGKLGPLHRTLFPYEFHFKSINTHILTPEPLNGDLIEDRQMILEALSRGRSFIGYDLPASTQGFRFTAQGMDSSANMGEEITSKFGVTLQIRLPRPAECHLLKNGKIVKSWQKRENCTYITKDPGIYRVEVYVDYLGKRRGWIFSNPIYIR